MLFFIIQPSFMSDTTKCVLVVCFFVPDYVEWPHFLSRAQFTGAHTQQKTLHRWHIHGVQFAYQNSLNVNREICGHMLRSISSSQHADMRFMCILTYQYSCSAACGYETTPHTEEDFSWSFIWTSQRQMAFHSHTAFGLDSQGHGFSLM